MKFNKLGLKVGDIVRLDAGFNNSSNVEITWIAPNGLFSQVKSDGLEWCVMTNRLSKIIVYEKS